MRERGASFAAILSSYITYVRTLCKFFLALKIFFWWSLSTECAAEKADKPLSSDSSDDDIFQRLLITSPGLPPPPPPPSNFRHFAITVVVAFVEDDVTQLGFPCPLAHTFTEREREREREMNLDKTRERKKERKKGNAIRRAIEKEPRPPCFLPSAFRCPSLPLTIRL